MRSQELRGEILRKNLTIRGSSTIQDVNSVQLKNCRRLRQNALKRIRIIEVH